MLVVTLAGSEINGDQYDGLNEETWTVWSSGFGVKSSGEKVYLFFLFFEMIFLSIAVVRG